MNNQSIANEEIDELIESNTIYRCRNRGIAESRATVDDQVAERLRKVCGLDVDSDLAPFNTDMLGSILGPAAVKITAHIQAPKELSAFSVLATAALAAQGHFNVNRQGGLTGPISIYVLSIAESGDRKSAVDALALAPIREFESVRRETKAVLDRQYRVDFDLWIANEARLDKDFTGKKIDQTQYREAKLELEASKPRKPKPARITLREGTAEGIYKHLQIGEPTAGLFSDEGVGFLAGHGMSDDSRARTTALLTDLWGGSTITRTRANSDDSSELVGRRLSAHLMTQPGVAEKFLGNASLEDQGILGRFLIVECESLKGTRTISGKPPTDPTNDPDLIRYNQAITRLLDREIRIDESTGGLHLDTLDVAGDAYHTWATYHDGIEKHCGPDGRYYSIRSYAAKAAENIARIAGILAAVESVEISPAHIHNAAGIVQHSLETVLSRANRREPSKEYNDLVTLGKWLRENRPDFSADFKSFPTPFRSAKKARPLLAKLAQAGVITVTTTNEKTGQPAGWRVCND